MRSSREATRSLMPSRSAESADSCSSVDGRGEELADLALGVGERSHALGGERAPRERRQARARTRRLAATSSMRLGEPHRPGHDRGEGQPDHHRLHHDVGLEEHAPGREIARQHGGADDRWRQRRRNRSFRLLRPGGAGDQQRSRRGEQDGGGPRPRPHAQQTPPHLPALPHLASPHRTPPHITTMPRM